MWVHHHTVSRPFGNLMMMSIKAMVLHGTTGIASATAPHVGVAACIGDFTTSFMPELRMLVNVAAI
jgi:hypothetical protein